MKYENLTPAQKDYVETLHYYQLKGYKEDYEATMKEIKEKDRELYNYIINGK